MSGGEPESAWRTHGRKGRRRHRFGQDIAPAEVGASAPVEEPPAPVEEPPAPVKVAPAFEASEIRPRVSKVHYSAVIEANNECIDMYNQWVALGGYTENEWRCIRDTRVAVTKCFFTRARCPEHGPHLVEHEAWRDYMGACETVKVDGEVFSQRW